MVYVQERRLATASGFSEVEDAGCGGLGGLKWGLYGIGYVDLLLLLVLTQPRHGP